MLAKKFRLTKEKDIARTFKGESARGSFFVIKGARNKFGQTRTAIIVGKKVSAKSTARNLVKRRISEALKENIAQINGFDISITALPASEKASFEEIRKSLRQLLDKGGFIKREK